MSFCLSTLCLATLLLATGCAGEMSPGAIARATVSDGGRAHDFVGGSRDGTSAADGTTPERPPEPTGDGSGDSAAKTIGVTDCVLGGADHCQTCSDRCPGVDSRSTERLCNLGLCDLRCRGEAYDVNGVLGDGCEGQDDFPLHAHPTSARDLGAVSDCDGARTMTGVLPSDDRLHVDPPTLRLAGRSDWYRLAITDEPFCLLDGTLTLDLALMPPTARVGALAFYECADGHRLAPVSGDAPGGTALVLTPPTRCRAVGSDTGTLRVEVKKLAGPHSAAPYALSVQP